MKTTLFRTLLSALLITFLAQYANAQGIVINKTNGQKIYYKASEVESVGVYGYGENPGPDPQDGKKYTVNGVEFVMVYVEGGIFRMGWDEDVESDEYPEHNVTLTSFCIGETEVTQELWNAVMGSNPSHFIGDKLPVESVSWNDCQMFIEKLNALTGKNFRLPTEAEWEYAARGGKLSKGYKFSGGDELFNVAWCADNSSEKTHEVATKQANELGLYDMTGNVWEWCQDWYGNYSGQPQYDPSGPEIGLYRVFRGGAWSSSENGCRTVYRNDDEPTFIYNALGLRLAL